MSDLQDLLVAIAFAAGCSVLFRSMRADRKLPGWWFAIAIVPLLSWGMALSVLAFPRMVPANWDPATDFNAGRADFVALGFFGVALPAAYLIIAVPATLLFRILTKRRKAR